MPTGSGRRGMLLSIMAAKGPSGQRGDQAPSAGGRPSATTDSSLEQAKPTQELLDEIHVAASAKAGASHSKEFGEVGLPSDRRSPFFVGFVGAVGVACAFALGWILVAAGQILV